MNKRPSELDFQKFYYTKVAMGEGCGCAERIIDVHEFDRRALSHRPKRSTNLSLKPLLRKIGLLLRG